MMDKQKQLDYLLEGFKKAHQTRPAPELPKRFQADVMRAIHLTARQKPGLWQSLLFSRVPLQFAGGASLAAAAAAVVFLATGGLQEMMTSIVLTGADGFLPLVFAYL
jgi:hypothetical protein